MTIHYTPALEDYMRKTGKRDIAVEVVSSNSSDFEVTELHIHFVSDKQSAFFREKKGYRAVEAPLGSVLLPPYRLEYGETVTFELKSFLGIKHLKCKGIKL